MLTLNPPKTIMSNAQLEAPPGITVGQWAVEFGALLQEYVDLDASAVLEIGTWQGGTLYHWLNAAPLPATIISLDKGPTNWRPAQPDFDVNLWYDWAPDGVGLHILQEDSHDPATVKLVEDIASNGLDFLFIDGDHTYKGARSDWEMYGPLVRPGGIVAFHDLITPPGQQHIEILRLWREIQRAGYKTRELYSFPGQPWGGIGVVYV